MKINTDTQKCLEALQRAGSEGVHSFHLNQIIGTTRAAARCQDLKDQGYNITSQWEKMGNSTGVRYFLHEGANVKKNTKSVVIDHQDVNNSATQQKELKRPINITYKFIGNVAVAVKI
jgi:hypothetical protein